tara:strand:- start:74713 stop:76293 length:1581 start_codon:yes stop_codon:yes gene_type:complete
MFNLWTIWWNTEGFLQGTNSYWNAPIFHPIQNTFAFSEPQTITMLMAPINWFTDSRVLTYNIYLWLSLLFNGLFTFLLLRKLGVNRSIAIGGGAAMLLLPIVHWQLDVVQLTPLWGILWTWLVLLKISRHPTLLRGAELGIAFGFTFLICGHQGLFLAVLLLGATWTLWKRCLNPILWATFAVGVSVAALLTGPVIFHLKQAANENNFIRSSNTVLQLSALPGDYTASTGRQLINLNTREAHDQRRLSPGWFKIGLAITGVIIGLIRNRWRWWTVFILITLLLAFSLSLGPNLRIYEWRPWWTLTEYCPGFSQVRNVFRFAFFVQMTIVLLAAQGLYGAFLLSKTFCAKKLQNYLAKPALLILGLIALFEVTPPSPALGKTPSADRHAGWITYIQENTPPDHAIACVPFARGVKVKDFESTTRWMYFATFHGVPLVNGYSGFFPDEYFEISEAINTEPPSEAIFRQLADSKVEFLVVMRSQVKVKSFSDTRFDTVSLEHVYSDPVGVDVYRLQRIETLRYGMTNQY